jgi:hypothetical protein
MFSEIKEDATMLTTTLKTLFFGFLLALLPVLGFGQYYIWGQDPGSLKWKQIRTEHFHVIFSEGYEAQGSYVADVLELTYELGSLSLGHRPRKVPVIIHNQTVVSNGFVSWAPRRLEIFSNPPQNNYAHDWLEQLAVHEFRHVVQVDKLNQGVTHYLSFLLGEQAPGAVFGLFVPMWFAEGDAVAVETGLSNSGRGSMPSFEQGLRAQVLEKGMYSFEKAFFGSFKDYVPNYYELGYQMVAAGRLQYGSDIWEKVMTDVGRKPIPLFPFSRSLQKHAGVSEQQHYRQTFESLDSAWREQDRRINPASMEVITQPNSLYTDYRYPSFVNDTLLVALKTGLEEIPRVISIDQQGQEQTLFRPGLVNTHGFSAGGGKVVWTEQRTDPRWEHRSWSEVHVYDLESGKRSRLTRRTRFFAPSISFDGEKIVVTEVSERNEYALVVLDAQSGQEVGRLTTPANEFLMTPAWHPDNRTLIAVALDETGKRIVTGDMKTGDFSTVFHAGYEEISRPSFTEKGEILFTGAFSGLEGIYWLNTKTGDLAQVVSSKYGARDAVVQPGKQKLLWSEYTAEGYVIARGINKEHEDMVPLERVENHSLKLHAAIREQEGGLVTRSNVGRQVRDIKPYYKFPNLFNLHSWSPAYIDAGNIEVRPGVALYFQDDLSTSVAVLGYDYDLNEEVGTYSLDYSYQGWYPVVNLYAGTGLRPASYRQGDNIFPFFFRESALKAGLSLPLTFRNYEWYYGINPSVRLAFTKAGPSNDSPDFLRRNDMHSMEYRFYAYRQQRSVARDIRPRWAHTIDVNYRHTPFSGTNMGSVFSARVTGFFPGVMRHHSLKLSAAWQEHQSGTRVEQTINYSFPNLISYPRGLSGQRHDRVALLSADYALPLIYPDLNIPYFVYLKRISANLFFDRAFTETTIRPESGDPYLSKVNLNSFGVDLIGDMHFFRFIQPIDLGVRMYHLPELEETGLQLLFGISF